MGARVSNSSHTSALSLWQSALHQVLSQQTTQQDPQHRGIGVTAQAPAMRAAAKVAEHFDKTGNLNVPLEASSEPVRAGVVAAPESGGGSAVAI